MGSRLENNSNSVRKRIAAHTFDDEDGEEYEGSKFGGFSDYFRRKKTKLQNLDADIRAHSADKPQIFKGIVAHVNGYTQPSLNDLHTLIVQHGGGFLQYLDGKTTVTHIIASNLTPKKVVEFKRYRIVKPAWVVDSIKAGKLLPWNEYRVVDEGENQKLLAFDNGKVSAKKNVKAKGYRDQTEASWYTSQLRGSQSGPSVNSPSGAVRSRSSKQRLPTPDEDIEDLPLSHQLDVAGPGLLTQLQEAAAQPEKLVTPPKTSPRLGPQQPLDEPPAQADTVNRDDSLYADPLPPDAPHSQDDAQDEVLLPDSEGREMPWIKNAVAQNANKTLSAEQHNAILLSDPNIRKSTVVHPDFLEQYYRESRLHHLSTWKANLKTQLQVMANEKTSSQKLKQKRTPGSRRYILHVDFDSFFAAVSIKKFPQWKDKPAVVAHGNGSGSEIASCNYPARKFGVKNGMWMKKAQELCPELKILPYDFPAYEEASRSFYDAILATGGVVQSVSVDEALVDVSNLCIAIGGTDGRKIAEGSIDREQTKANELAQFLRDQVKEKTGCNVSVGVGGNILLAKVALRRAKPAGQYQIKPEEVLDFIGELQVQDLPGVAWSIGGKLEEAGIKLVKDIRGMSKERLTQILGPKTGEKLWEYSRGIDKTEVGEQVVRKSVSAEVNWGVRFENQEQADEFIGSLCGELQKRLLKERVKGKQFTMKIMRRSPDAPLDPPKHLGHGKCDTFNKSLILGVATNSKEVLTREALAILRGFGFSPGELRGIGVQMTKLEPMRSATDGNVESSQRRLHFKTINEPQPITARKVSKASAVADEDPIQDDPETPRKPKSKLADVEHVAFGPPELNHSTPSRRPLNMMGTQFIVPTQVDPKVLAELPDDIRTKLLRQQGRQSSPTRAGRGDTEANHRLQSPPKPIPFALTALPAHSQLDPEILAALPEDVCKEVMAQYAAGAMPSSPSRHARADQTLLPQSPRKNRIIGIPAKKPIALPLKRGRGRPPKSAQLAAAAAAHSKARDGKTLTQANFISLKNPGKEGGGVSVDAIDVEDLDPDFLSALPEQMRQEVIEEHKSKRLQAQCLAVKQKRDVAPAIQVPLEPLVIKVPRPAKAFFTNRKLSRKDDLRRAMKDWVHAFADEGPYPEDTGALVKYLHKVILEEKDLDKAVGMVRWLDWLIDDLIDDQREIDEEKWRKAMGEIKEGALNAGKERGLGAFSFN